MSVIFFVKCALLSFPVFANDELVREESTDPDGFRRHLYHAKHLLVIAGAGISEESGITTMRMAEATWRKRKVETFVTPEGFEADPGLVWEYFHYRRELVLPKKPNKVHLMLVEVEKWLLQRNANFTLITTCVDGLHKLAGSKHVVELHGSLFETMCTKCKTIKPNRDSPICPALKGTDQNVDDFKNTSDIKPSKLPRCAECGGLLRPTVIMEDEDLDMAVNDHAWDMIDLCDLTAIIGTENINFPGAIFSPNVPHRNVPVAVFNRKAEGYLSKTDFFFGGPSIETVPKVFDLNWSDPEPEKNKSTPDHSESFKSSRSFNSISSSDKGSDHTKEITYSVDSDSSESSSDYSSSSSSSSSSS